MDNGLQLIGNIIALIFEFLQRPVVVFGYTFSLWGVLIFSIVAGIVGSLIWGLFE